MHRRGVGAREKEGELTGRDPTDRGGHGSKYHLLCDANGLPLHALISGRGGGRRNCTQTRAYDYRRCRAYLTRRGIKVLIDLRRLIQQEF